MHTGQKLKLMRTLLGLTQEEVADKIHRTRALVATIEKKGTGHPNTIADICKALKIRQDQLEQLDEKSIREMITGQNEPDKKEVEFMKREIELLKDLVDEKQTRINMLEEELANYKRRKK